MRPTTDRESLATVATSDTAPRACCRITPEVAARRRRSEGFTLVELLAVMVVLGILVSLALPIVNKVKDRGNVTACASNLRQIALLLDTTVTGRLKGVWPKEKGVKLLLQPYKYKEIEGKDLSIYLCPGTNDVSWPSEDLKDEWGAGYKDWDNIDTACISYAGYDGTLGITKHKTGNMVLAADDNQFGPNHPHITNIVYFDGKVDSVDIVKYEDQLPEGSEFVPVGPESPDPYLAKLLIDF